MEHNKHLSEKIEFLQKASTEFAKEQELNKQTAVGQDEFVKEDDSKIQNFEIETKTACQYLKRYQYTSFDDSRAPKPFRVKLTPRNVHYSSDSYSSDSDLESDSDTEVIAEEHSGIQKSVFPFDDSRAPKPFRVKLTPRNVHYSSDSYSLDSDSESDSATKEESRLQKENSPNNTAKEVEFQHNAAPDEDKTPPDPKEVLDFDPKSQTNKTVLADLISGPNIPDSSILVKHGTKHPAEAGDKDGDKDSKRAKTSQE